MTTPRAYATPTLSNLDFSRGPSYNPNPYFYKIDFSFSIFFN